jgi:hypothetical protein
VEPSNPPPWIGHDTLQEPLEADLVGARFIDRVETCTEVDLDP